MQLNVVAILQLLKESGIVLHTEPEGKTGIDELDRVVKREYTSTNPSKGQYSSIFATDSSIRGWLSIPLDEGGSKRRACLPVKL